MTKLEQRGLFAELDRMVENVESAVKYSNRTADYAAGVKHAVERVKALLRDNVG